MMDKMQLVELLDQWARSWLLMELTRKDKEGYLPVKGWMDAVLHLSNQSEVDLPSEHPIRALERCSSTPIQLSIGSTQSIVSVCILYRFHRFFIYACFMMVDRHDGQ